MRRFGGSREDMPVVNDIKNRKSVLIFTAGFFPAKRYGGPVVSVFNLCALLKDEFKFFIVANDHDLGSKEKLSDIKQGWNEHEDYSVLYLSEDEKIAETYNMIIDEVNPQSIYLNSLFDYRFTIPILRIAKEKSIKVILAPRGQLCKNALKKKYKKIPYLILYKKLLKYRNIKYQATSMEELESIEKYIGVEKSAITLLENIPSLPKNIPERLEKNPGSVRLIFLSRIHPKKNLIGAIRLIKDLEGDVLFDIYGPIEDEKYWALCQKEIKACKKNIKVNYMGEVSHDKIHETFSKYHFFLFPTFSENYGHVIVESMLAGTPVIISDQTPWNDVKKENAGFVLNIKEINCNNHTMNLVLEMQTDKYIHLHKNCLNYIKRCANFQKMKQNYSFLFHNPKNHSEFID
jgi:glycosyltransferase involved in cell wall biosynthesis